MPEGGESRVPRRWLPGLATAAAIVTLVLVWSTAASTLAIYGMSVITNFPHAGMATGLDWVVMWWLIALILVATVFGYTVGSGPSIVALTWFLASAALPSFHLALSVFVAWRLEKRLWFRSGRCTPPQSIDSEAARLACDHRWRRPVRLVTTLAIFVAVPAIIIGWSGLASLVFLNGSGLVTFYGPLRMELHAAWIWEWWNYAFGTTTFIDYPVDPQSYPRLWCWFAIGAALPSAVFCGGAWGLWRTTKLLLSREKDTVVTPRSTAQWRRRVVLLAILLALAPWALGGKAFTGVETSPDGAYRIVYYTPPRWQRWLSFDLDEPTIAELTRTDTNDILGRSWVFERAAVNSGGVIWRPEFGHVLAGSGTRFFDVPHLPPPAGQPR